MYSSTRFLVTKGELFTTSFMIIYLFICGCFKYECPMILNWFGILFFFYSIYTWKIKTKDKWLSPYFILMIFFTVFNCGISIMWALNIHKVNELGTKVMYYTSGYIPSQKDIIEAQFYTAISMFVFHLGALFSVKRNNMPIVKRSILSERNYLGTKDAMRIVCGALLLITAPVAIYTAARDVVLARIYGYGSLYYGSSSTQGGYVQILMFFFFPALVGVLISCDFNKKSKRLCYSIFAVYAFLGVLSGDRGNWLYSLMVLVWLHSLYKNVSIKKYLQYAVLAVVGIYLLSVVTAARNSGLTFKLSDFVNAFNAENSPIVDAFYEMGGSIGIILFFLHSGNEIYPYANTYLTSILGVVSTRMLSLFGLKQVLIADWFSQDYLKISWGTGFSMIGEAYVNGGYFGGFVYMSILGFIHGKILNKASSAVKENFEPIQLFIAAASLKAIMGLTRGALYLTLKEAFFGVFIVYWMIVFLRKSRTHV